MAYDPNRILVFSSEKGLDDLESSRNWACDGTFKMLPSLRCQLVTLHVVAINWTAQIFSHKTQLYLLLEL